MCFRHLSIIVGLALSSCALQKLPDAATMDKYYQHAVNLNKDRLHQLEERRAQGLLDDYHYQQEKAALEAEIGQKATDLAWMRHDMQELKMESLGLPTPDRPQEISVPEAGGLPTGGGYRRFNDSAIGGNSMGDSREAMRRAAAGNMPGNNTRR